MQSIRCLAGGSIPIPTITEPPIGRSDDPLCKGDGDRYLPGNGMTQGTPKVEECTDRGTAELISVGKLT